KAVPREQELQRRDIPAEAPCTEHSSAEWRPAERLPRRRTEHAVGRKAASRLEPANRTPRTGPERAVDGTGVEATPLQRDLERGDVGITEAVRSHRKRPRRGECCSKADPAPHC